MNKSQRTLELEKQLAASIAQDKADSYKSPESLSLDELYNKWAAELSLIGDMDEIPRCNGLRHDLEQFRQRIRLEERPF